MTVFITGASSGSGAALAREFARGGAPVALAARRIDRLRELAAGIESAGGKALAVRCDVNADGDVERAVAEAARELGPIDVAVANAGFGVVGKFEELSLDDYRRQLETNVFGVLRTARAALPELRRTRGTLAVLGSAAGHLSAPRSSPYSMSKFALRAWADALRGELRPEGIAVVLLSPGFVDSDIRRVDNSGTLHAEAPDTVPGWLRMPADVAARKIVRAIRRRRREAVITFHGKVLVFFARHFPGLTAFILDRLVRARPEPGAQK